MTAQAMSSAICSALSGAGYKPIAGGADFKQYNKEFIDALARGIVAEIKANAKAIDTDAQHGGSWSIQ